MKPEFDLNLGDILGGETHIVKWWLNCSLKGVFTNLSVSYTNKNPLGDPRLSIIEELKIHQLMKEVKVGERIDFLVREKQYGNIIPDQVIASNDLSVQNVTNVQYSDVILDQEGSSLQAQVSITANISGQRCV